MSRRRPDHPRITDADPTAAGAAGRRDRRRSRRGRRAVVRGAIKTIFWALVLAGVFILGIGYGATVGGSDEQDVRDVTITQEPIEVQATLPTVTETVTKTVTTTRKGRSSKQQGK